MPVKYFASKVTVSLICPSRNNRGQKMIAPPTAIYNHGPGLNNLMPFDRQTVELGKSWYKYYIS